MLNSVDGPSSPGRHSVLTTNTHGYTQPNTQQVNVANWLAPLILQLKFVEACNDLQELADI